MSGSACSRGRIVIFPLRVKMKEPHLTAGVLEAMEEYRKSALSRLLWWLWWFVSLLLHPTKIWKAAHFWIKIQLWICFYYNRFTSRYREKKALIEWVRSRVRNYTVPGDFSTGWTDGILLCALLDSMYPGSCPRYDLLNPDNSLSNMQLAFLLIEKHTPVRLDITAEEVVEGQPGIKKAIRSIVAQLKLISAKTDLQKALGRLPNNTGEIQYASKQECFAKGMGLILAVRGRRATFNVFTRPTHSFCIVVEIRGPDGSISKQTITNKSPRSKVLRLSDYRDENGMQTKNVLVEYEIFPGKVAVKYRPALTGKHQLSIIWHGQHVMGSPYAINVEDSRDDDEPLTPSPTNSPAPSVTNFNDVVRDEMLRRIQRVPQNAPSQSQQKTRRRRIIRRVIRCNGKEFVIAGDDKEELKRVLMCISNNKSATRRTADSWTQQQSHVVPSEKVQDTRSESLRAAPSETASVNGVFVSSSVKVETPVIVISAASPPPDERKGFDSAKAQATDLDTNALNSVQESSTPTCDVGGHADEAAARMSPSCKENCAENVIKTSLPSSSSTERHESVPDNCHVSDTCLQSNPPKLAVVRCDVDSNAENMPLLLGVSDDTTLNSDNSRRLSRQLPVITEETEKRFQTGISALEEAEEIENITHTTECSTKYEFSIHRSSVTVNIQADALSDPLESECPGTADVTPAITSVPSNEESAWAAFVGSESLPRCRTVRRRILQRQSTACDGSTEEETMDPPTLSSYPETDASTSSSVKNMIKSWERKQKEQVSLAENMTDKVTNTRLSPKPVTTTLHSSLDVPTCTETRMTKVRWEGEPSRGIRDAFNISPKARPDVYEGLKSLLPHSRSVWQKQRRYNPRRKLFHKRALVYPGIFVSTRAREPASSTDFTPKNILTSTFSHHATRATTTKVEAPVCKDRRLSSPDTLWHIKDTEARGNLPRWIEGMASLLPTSVRDHAEGQYDRKDENLLYELHQEYIDDEIPNAGTLLLDRYTAFNNVIYRDDELHKLFEISPSHPENCVALGSRLYFGQVGAENHFQVDASRAGVGPISIGIQGPTEGAVIKVSVTYSGLGNYTVMYKVNEPGYYIIYVRWADWPVPDSPFVCKISA
ncbi:uncharacterized protein LOC135385337 isoform X2 [Ornithodoros turicata]|uniref:uncharacterized protein LOC135385337 isoform X2 n=1 Tax=Ornithodoros turicata TaxID=34597 RepID=UPI0031398E8B